MTPRTRTNTPRLHVFGTEVLIGVTEPRQSGITHLPEQVMLSISISEGPDFRKVVFRYSSVGSRKYPVSRPPRHGPARILSFSCILSELLPSSK
jgi:hypothetical protein